MNNRTIASLALTLCSLIGGCAADQNSPAVPDRDPGYTPTGSNIPRRAPKSEAPAINSTGPTERAKVVQ